MRIICTIMKQEWFMSSKIWQLILNSLLQERLHDIQIRKTRRVLLSSIKKISQEKKIKWAIWNAKKLKIMYQINEFLEKSDNKLKLLKIKQKKKQMKQMKVTLFWWKWKIIYDLKLIAWQLALIKDSEKHHESEKSKKKSIQELSSDASEISIN